MAFLSSPLCFSSPPTFSVRPTTFSCSSLSSVPTGFTIPLTASLFPLRFSPRVFAKSPSLSLALSRKTLELFSAMSFERLAKESLSSPLDFSIHSLSCLLLSSVAAFSAFATTRRRFRFSLSLLRLAFSCLRSYTCAARFFISTSFPASSAFAFAISSAKASHFCEAVSAAFAYACSSFWAWSSSALIEVIFEF